MIVTDADANETDQSVFEKVFPPPPPSDKPSETNLTGKSTTFLPLIKNDRKGKGKKYAGKRYIG